jgi:hypothetical protein
MTMRKRLCLLAHAVTVAVIYASLSRLSGAEFLADGNFDNLPLGSTPIVEHLEDDVVLRKSGAWEFYDVGTGDSVYSIVDTASFDPGRPGRSLHIMSSHPGGMATNDFLSPIAETRGEAVRVSYDIWIADNGTATKAGVGTNVGSIGDRLPFARSERGTQVQWDEDQQIAVLECTSADCAEFSYRQLQRYTPDTWQHVQLAIDLTTDRYDVFWSDDENPMTLLASNVRFRGGAQETLARFGALLYNNGPWG